MTAVQLDSKIDEGLPRRGEGNDKKTATRVYLMQTMGFIKDVVDGETRKVLKKPNPLPDKKRTGKITGPFPTETKKKSQIIA